VISYIYSDLNQYTPTKYSISVDVESIYQSISNILSTPIGTREWEPLFGSAISTVLFELILDETAFLILTLVVSAIERWEPRVRVIQNESTVIADEDNHKYAIDLRFEIIGLDNEKFEYRGDIIPDTLDNRASSSCGDAKLQPCCTV
jgi:phage baseplate assembly protein W